MPRYLLYFSYIGTHFIGSQRQLLATKAVDHGTIQGLLEGALTVVWTKFKQDLPSKASVKLSSRTDSKVHAFVNTAHFDMTCEQNGISVTPEVVTQEMNKAIRKIRKWEDICILRTRIVPNDFHCRFNVVSRSYMYRLALSNSDVDLSSSTDHKYRPLLPIVEQCRCFVVSSSNFNFGSFHAAMQLFRGTHNFASFMKRPYGDFPLEKCVKQLELQVVPGKPFLNQCYDPLYENLSFYEIHFQTRSFLYRQVRNMVGAAVGVGQEKMTYEQVRFMLENPVVCFGGSRISTYPAPPDALYLTDVMYNSLDLEVPGVESVTHGSEEQNS